MHCTMSSTKEQLVSKFGLLPHPEGGFYSETYRSDESVETHRGNRSASTAIYFLVESRNVSRLHRIAADECWHFYCGSPLVVVELDERTKLHKETVLGADIAGGQHVQHFVRRNTWFGCHLLGGAANDSFCFVGCTVAPGFDFADFELGSRAYLMENFDESSHEAIMKLTEGLP